MEQPAAATDRKVAVGILDTLAGSGVESKPVITCPPAHESPKWIYATNTEYFGASSRLC